MLNEKISQALSGITDSKLESALNVYERKQKRRARWFRAAACAAMVAILLTAIIFPIEVSVQDAKIVVAPGLLKVYAYDLQGTDVSAMNSYELKDGVVSHPFEWTFAMNSLYGLPITLRVEDEAWKDKNLTFQVETEYGGYYGDIRDPKYKKDKEDKVASLSDVNFGNKFTVENNETIFWTAKDLYVQAAKDGVSPSEFLDRIDNEIYTRIIIRSDEHIVGYAVVKITHSQGWYSASVEKTVFYPLVDGQFQPITEEYIQAEMSKQNRI